MILSCVPLEVLHVVNTHRIVILLRLPQVHPFILYRLPWVHHVIVLMLEFMTVHDISPRIIIEWHLDDGHGMRKMSEYILVPSLAGENPMAIPTRSLNIGLDIVGFTIFDPPFRVEGAPLEELKLA